MPRRTIYDEEMKLLQKWKKSSNLSREFTEFRRLWRARGPVLFAEHILKIDPNTGRPLQLSDDQKELLLDLAFNGVKLAIIIAGRGAGKTFCLAVYIMWRIFTHENWGISCMGGSREQSDKIHSYISGWINNSEELNRYTLKCTLSEVKTYSGSVATFHACSGTSVRGEHTHELIIDEQAAGEEAGKTRYIEAAIWEVSTSPDIHIIKSSTAQYIHGDFIKTWNNADKLGYKRYRWAIAKHISGNKDPYQIYKDENPDNWSSNLPWIDDTNIKILRRNKSNDEWLVEALGGISRSSGLVFNPLDIDIAICDYCPRHDKECKPYKEGYCPLLHVQFELMGIPKKSIEGKSVSQLLRNLKDRVEGIDWGRVSQCAYTVLGRFNDYVFVLDHIEEAGMSDYQKVKRAIDLAKKWKVEIIRPDPREWVLNNQIADAGFAVHELFSEKGGIDKIGYISTFKRYVERHRFIIPYAFQDLIRSLKTVTYTKEGKIMKKGDHSFDSALYAISYYGEFADTAIWTKAITTAEEESKKREEAERKNEEGKEDVVEEEFPPKKKRGDEDNIWKGFDLWT